jgi:tripartite-type tricarboxylate transporter receptor subunit TctC
MLNRRQLCAGAAAFIDVARAGSTHAQALPRTIKMIVVVPPGASMDNVTRLVAERLRDRTGRHVLVDYKPGGTGLVASQFLQTTEPDGSHVMFAPLAVAAFFPFLFSKLSFHPDTDLMPVCDGVHIPHTLTASIGSGWQSLAQFLAAAKADPLKGSIGTSSMSSVGALLMLRLRALSGVDLQLVAYKGGTPLLADLMGNQISAGISVVSDYLAQHHAGRVRILATGGARRSPLAPEIPTLAESGYPDLYGVSSIGFFVRGGTPPPLVALLSQEITAIVRDAQVRERLLAMGAEPVGGTPEAFRSLVLSERRRWEPVARAANIRIE